MKYKYELLNEAIADEFRNKSKYLNESNPQDIGTRRKLKEELMNRCGVMEVEAVNILNGRNVKDYIRKYEIVYGIVHIEVDKKEKEKSRYLLEELAKMEAQLYEARLWEQDEKLKE